MAGLHHWSRVADDSDYPSVFHSLESGGPFLFCAACGLSLRDEADSYVVGKSYHRGECVFECAMCDDCQQRLHNESSEESREAIASFMESRIDFEGRIERLCGNLDPEAWLESCAICDTPRVCAERYSIKGLFAGNGIVFGPAPLGICGRCEDELGLLVSKKTRDVWDDFKASHFDGPPALGEDLPAGSGPMMF